MQIEIAKFSHIGNRDENQDEVEILISDHTVLAMVIDGMGGHAAGAQAATTSIATISKRFDSSRIPLPYPHRFLTRAIADAHDAVVELGRDDTLDARPRATCAMCLIQDGTAFWAHVGDSRIYHLRDGKVVNRTRDHTHVELLLQEGLIVESEIAGHPMRSFVEHCLGGEATRPPVTVSGPHALQSGDILMACSDGIWGGLSDHNLASAFTTKSTGFQDLMEQIVGAAVASNAPNSDNATAAAIKWVGTDP